MNELEIAARKKKIVKEALVVVNRIRQACGMPPLDDLKKGEKGSQYSCPIANSLSNGHKVSVAGYLQVDNSMKECFASAEDLDSVGTYVMKGCFFKEKSGAFNQFISEFDAGNLPQYEGEWE